MKEKRQQSKERRAYRREQNRTEQNRRGKKSRREERKIKGEYQDFIGRSQEKVPHHNNDSQVCHNHRCPIDHHSCQPVIFDYF